MTEYLKIRSNLIYDGRVLLIAERLDVSVAQVLGGLLALILYGEQYGLCSPISESGVKALDATIDVPGFVRAVESVGWARIENGYLSLADFSSPTYESSKRKSV